MATVWGVLDAMSKYDGSPTAHKDVVDCLNRHGHNVKMSDAWCTMTVMAALYDADAIKSIGGYKRISGDLKKQSEKKGIWKAGKSDILPGDIVVYGRSGKPNHTELCVGYGECVSGNYAEISKDTCARRSWLNRSSVMGRVRPKYASMPEMDDLQLAIIAADVILGVYGSESTRTKMLSVFGKANVPKIQAEVERVDNSVDDTIFIMSVSAIAGHMSKGKYREKRLGKWASKVQSKINEIDAMRGKTTGEAAQLVIDGKFGTREIRKLLLKFCGYDAEKVQKRVNEMLEQPKEAEPAKESPEGSIVFLFRDVARPTKDVDGLQGDCWIIKSGGHALIGDTMMAGALEKITAEIQGCTNICLYFSHEHGDHMSSNGNKLIKQGIIKKCYVPAAGIISKESKYQKRYKQLLKDCASKSVEVVELKGGSVFDVGPYIHGEVIHQQNSGSDSINMHSLCTLFTVAGETYLTCGDHHCGEKDSTLKAPGHVRIYKSSHHQLFTGDGPKWVDAISPEWIIGSGWQSYPNATIGQDAKTRRAQKAYQAVGNLLPSDVCGRTELFIKGGIITAKGERNMVGKTVKYVLNGKTYQKTVHVCAKAAFVKVQSMLPENAQFA